MSAPCRFWNVIGWLATCLMAWGHISRIACGGVIFDASGTAASGRLVVVRATLAISGDSLTVDLENVSPMNTVEASEVLSSFYFDIRKAASQPALSFVSATGFVWLVQDGTKDVAYRYVPQTFTQVGGVESDLRATKDGDGSWQFRAMDAVTEPFLGFGLGTVGNARLPANGFTPSIVGPPGNSMLNFGIFSGGDLDPKGTLANRYLVKNRATFQFKGAGGYGETDIIGRAVFGLGSSPDSLITAVPEPATSLLTLAGVVVLAVVCWRKRPIRRSRADGTS